MDLQAIEKDIIAKIKAGAAASALDFNGVRIKSLPGNPLESPELYDPIGGIFVRYDGSSYERPDPNRNKTTTQKRNPRWGIYISFRNEFESVDDPGHNKTDNSAGIYIWFDFIKETLLGYTPGSLTSVTNHEVSTILSLVSDRVVDHVDGLWFYEMIWEHITPEVES